ncbi:protein tyrosine/serine phosphatase [Amycolatopsis bartoniae]|uniref:tyrosine-protein phosphatase n=1 Tax=Amycolatopsis bartoniae TaxID=941986 RepID=UPI00184652EC|nr:tyrosine-protein phosphatase [Amycolatopsis bartoniae]MBB2936816.1 protein tyrosine/serine phosphatase [Amycolatopsis bartoniae]
MTLTWHGCPNGRDVGGLPSSSGSRIRFGALFRSDSHSRLTTEGIAAVRAVGLSRIFDLRWPRETAQEPSPFAGDPAYRNAPMIAELAEQGTTMPDAYRSMLDDNQRRITGVFIQLSDAPPGPLAVHCSAGSPASSSPACHPPRSPRTTRSRTAAVATPSSGRWPTWTTGTAACPPTC